MNKYFNYFFSIPFALFLMLLFALAIGTATFVENDYGTITAKALIFNSWWLELCLFLLSTIFIKNIFQYKLHQPRKLPILFLHLSFILIIIGAGVTRYIGNEGMMRIREGSFNNQFVSSTTFLDVKVHDNKHQYKYTKPLLLSSISNNAFTIPNGWEKSIIMNNQEVQIEYVDFIHDPKDEILINADNGYSILEFVVPAQSGGMQSEYLKIQHTRTINGLSMSFENNLKSDFSIYQVDSLFYFTCKYDVEYMRMSDQSKGFLDRNQKHLLNQKTLYTINEKNIVFKNHFHNAIIHQVSSSIKNDEAKSDLLKIKVVVEDQDTIIDLYGTKGLLSPKTYFDFNDLFFSFSYGSKNYSLENKNKESFAIQLDSFRVERYPFSNTPSAYTSYITLIDGNNTRKDSIFMNNILNYHGYRFFQSSYDNDEKGTILSVNQDQAGTILTYLGYSSLLISIISLFISRFSRINLLSKKNKQKK